MTKTIWTWVKILTVIVGWVVFVWISINPTEFGT